MDELFVGIDIGSSHAKATLVRQNGAVVAEVERPQEIARPQPGRAEQDPERDWWDTVVSLCRGLLKGLKGGRVAGVGVCALGPCLAVADAAGRPLRPAILYGIDTRAEREIEELRKRYGADAILARCGSPLSTQSVGPKLAWLARHDEVWPAVRTFFTAGSFLVHRLTGEYVLDHHSASQCGPLYDVNQNRWIEEWAGEIAPALRLPRLAWAQETLGRVTEAAAAATGLPKGVPVAGGTIDSWGEVAASGLRGPGEGLLVYGSTIFLIEVDTPARPDPRLWSTTAFTPGSRNLAAGTASAGALVAWLRDLTGGAPLDALAGEAAVAGPGAGGLLALPYFAGERTPLFDPDARGLLLGLTVSHTRGHVLRALLEGTAFAVRHNLEAMHEAGGTIRRLRASGGGTRDKLWTQIVSDVTGLPQAILSGAGGGSQGAALLAAVAAGAADLETSWPRGHTEVRPHARHADLYDQLYGLYRDLYPATADAAHALAHLQPHGHAHEDAARG